MAPVEASPKRGGHNEDGRKGKRPAERNPPRRVDVLLLPSMFILNKAFFDADLGKGTDNGGSGEYNRHCPKSIGSQKPSQDQISDKSNELLEHIPCAKPRATSKYAPPEVVAP